MNKCLWLCLVIALVVIGKDGLSKEGNTTDLKEDAILIIPGNYTVGIDKDTSITAGVRSGGWDSMPIQDELKQLIIKKLKVKLSCLNPDYTITGLSIDDFPIELTSMSFKDGILHTKDFGDFMVSTEKVPEFNRDLLTLRELLGDSTFECDYKLVLKASKDQISKININQVEYKKAKKEHVSDINDIAKRAIERYRKM